VLVWTSNLFLITDLIHSVPNLRTDRLAFYILVLRYNLLLASVIKKLQEILYSLIYHNRDKVLVYERNNSYFKLLCVKSCVAYWNGFMRQTITEFNFSGCISSCRSTEIFIQS
jgi:hypothetical protein